MSTLRAKSFVRRPHQLATLTVPRQSFGECIAAMLVMWRWHIEVRRCPAERDVRSLRDVDLPCGR